ncbi:MULTISPECIES: imidazole glycerol phosphate synthase subunit HisF [Leptospira]|uniref:Imidazole glycerol phosphate synthase subunit HisF n=10 Tax=Leptospira TaxID=171 RepID=HIS6_LEPBJ|nr:MULTISPECIES: imidazole glycerol phosphate synthase subunit HisF [Leptospira]Q04SA6.1 RecName: Full=Imidazole glycerol phosphate synthase subunit HisF; AltName: Full=IGP synthase cyclase subunit; AltName: Full=IGP synthase subunit HisF; AltName: Full=ImGP synthase subunit HisF; Short=IGPS subunit HisF [Leptospira borgpetersenii serovar Hardjo-bovis str. JB197]Q050D2.1 RecName: Full=Imidazole glycerol phosphate synthase subunit HisF; AltName: Full=IGP synthase cyclase subunit; AltName: Full=IGP
MSNLTARVIPCLDIKDGRVVKGVNFVDLVDAGDPVESAGIYEENLADELCFLDITASSDRREILLHLVERIAEKIFIPFTVGGGIRTVADVKAVLEKGADKISINTAAFQNPELLTHSSEIYGSQCIVCAIDVKFQKERDRYEIFLHGGRTETGREALDWAREAVGRGAGEILLTSMDRDGTRNGFDINLLKSFSSSLEIPIIASGGAGNPEHMVEAILRGKADAVLAASIFHFGEYSIRETKRAMQEMGISVRLD